MRSTLLTLLWVAAFGAACGDTSGPSEVPGTELRFVLQDTLAPPLYAARDSFWAKVGDGREMKLFYQGATPADTGEEFLHFEVPGDGLLRRPDGSAFQAGDSILITVTVVDQARFDFAFEPAGLVFNPDHPARMKVRYLNAEKDFDGDGDEDAFDDEIETIIGLWHSVTAGTTWRRVGSVKFANLDEIDANIFTFSRYALAW